MLNQKWAQEDQSLLLECLLRLRWWRCTFCQRLPRSPLKMRNPPAQMVLPQRAVGFGLLADWRRLVVPALRDH